MIGKLFIWLWLTLHHKLFVLKKNKFHCIFRKKVKEFIKMLFTTEYQNRCRQFFLSQKLSLQCFLQRELFMVVFSIYPSSDVIVILIIGLQMWTFNTCFCAAFLLCDFEKELLKCKLTYKCEIN